MRGKFIDGFGDYIIYDNGKVWSSKSDKFLSQSIDRDGYKSVTLYNPDSEKTARIHKLVAHTFIDNPENYTQVNHKDLDPSNNNVNNLEWCDASYNMAHRYRNAGCIRGVTYENNRWRAKIYIEGHSIHLGNYSTKEEALSHFEFTYTLLRGEYPW
jgi:hypothetical protein